MPRSVVQQNKDTSTGAESYLISHCCCCFMLYILRRHQDTSACHVVIPVLTLEELVSNHCFLLSVVSTHKLAVLQAENTTTP